MEPKPPFISRVVLKNYKSIASCDVRLGTLQFLVGRNGSGKSNFLDALAFVRDALVLNNVNEACNRRVNFGFVTHHGFIEWERPVEMRLEFNLPDGVNGLFAFEMRGDPGKACKVTEETCVIYKNDVKIVGYEIRDGKVQDENPERFPPVSPDRLYLQNMSADPIYRPLYEALRTMEVYNLDPRAIIHTHNAKTDEALQSRGDNIARVLAALPQQAKERIRDYLQQVVPHVSDFEVNKIQDMYYLSFYQSSIYGDDAMEFPADSMSDGTLRALGVLTALLQEREGDGDNVPVLIGVEEPETALHARAVGALLGALQEASDMRQVIVTTHSADMLDNKEITPDQILPVEMQKSVTLIAPLGDMTKGMLRDHLATAGELLRQDMLPPNDGVFSDE